MGRTQTGKESITPRLCFGECLECLTIQLLVVPTDANIETTPSSICINVRGLRPSRSVDAVVCLCSPTQVLNAVVGLVSVDVVYIVLPFLTGKKRQRKKAMDWNRLTYTTIPNRYKPIHMEGRFQCLDLTFLTIITKRPNLTLSVDFIVVGIRRDFEPLHCCETPMLSLTSIFARSAS